jgi:hypothetical protein
MTKNGLYKKKLDFFKWNKHGKFILFMSLTRA